MKVLEIYEVKDDVIDDIILENSLVTNDSVKEAIRTNTLSENSPEPKL